MFIILLNYIAPLNRIDEVLEEHRAYLRKYYHMEKLVLSGPKSPRLGGVIIAKSSIREEIWTIIKEDPFWREGLAEYELVEFTPTMARSDLESLLKCGV